MLTFHGLPADFTEESFPELFQSFGYERRVALVLRKAPILMKLPMGLPMDPDLRFWLLSNIISQKFEALAKAPKLHVKTELHYVAFQFV
jgi:hypothetical protein